MAVSMKNQASYEDWLRQMLGTDLSEHDVADKPTPGWDGLAWRRGGQRIRFMPASHDIVAQCPNCKTVETLQFVEDRLTPCRKFSQKDGKIYHDCGSILPCRLHR